MTKAPLSSKQPARDTPSSRASPPNGARCSAKLCASPLCPARRNRQSSNPESRARWIKAGTNARASVDAAQNIASSRFPELPGKASAHPGAIQILSLRRCPVLSHSDKASYARPPACAALRSWRFDPPPMSGRPGSDRCSGRDRSRGLISTGEASSCQGPGYAAMPIRPEYIWRRKPGQQAVPNQRLFDKL